MLLNDLYIDKLSGEEFEQYLANLFQTLGYNVEFTKTSGDYGADLIISNSYEKKAVQAKRYNGSVGVSAIQEVASAKNYYNANKCMVVTNSYFTKNAIELADVNNVELIDRNSLLKLINLVYSKAKYIRKYNIPIPLKEYDELLPQSIDIIIDTEKIKTSILQIKLRVGYIRAANIIEELEKMKLISNRDSFGNRKFLLNIKLLKNPLNIALKIFIGLMIFFILSIISILNIQSPLLGSVCVIASLVISIVMPLKLGNFILIKFMKKKSVRS